MRHQVPERYETREFGCTSTTKHSSILAAYDALHSSTAFERKQDWDSDSDDTKSVRDEQHHERA